MMSINVKLDVNQYQKDCISGLQISLVLFISNDTAEKKLAILHSCIVENCLLQASSEILNISFTANLSKIRYC